MLSSLLCLELFASSPSFRVSEWDSVTGRLKTSRVPFQRRSVLNRLSCDLLFLSLPSSHPPFHSVSSLSLSLSLSLPPFLSPSLPPCFPPSLLLSFSPSPSLFLSSSPSSSPSLSSSLSSSLSLFLSLSPSLPLSLSLSLSLFLSLSLSLSFSLPLFFCRVDYHQDGTRWQNWVKTESWLSFSSSSLSSLRLVYTVCIAVNYWLVSSSFSSSIHVRWRPVYTVRAFLTREIEEFVQLTREILIIEFTEYANGYSNVKRELRVSYWGWRFFEKYL